MGLTNMKNQTWFITGVSGGFGKALAEELVKQGKQVIATFRKEEQAKTFETTYGNQVRAVLLDVNETNTIDSVVQQAWAFFQGVDVVVNNAGYGLTGAVEETTETEIRAQMETNFFGALFVTKAFLPKFRIQGHGTFVQISSQAGISSTPGLGIYNASKFALEGFSEALSKEAAHLGIRVMLVEPGPFRTDWAGNSMVFSPVELAEYASSAGVMRRRLSQISGNQPGDPIKGVQLIIRAVDSEKMPLRLALGSIAVDTISAKLKQVQSDVETWEQESRATDF
jgi:NAD(P)-dependent dehydrogenase (short-subunit alcohol dehydrogenase family)